MLGKFLKTLPALKDSDFETKLATAMSRKSVFLVFITILGCVPQLLLANQSTDKITPAIEKGASEELFPLHESVEKIVSWDIHQAEIVVNPQNLGPNTTDKSEKWSVIASLNPLTEKDNEILGEFSQPAADKTEELDEADLKGNDDEIIPLSEVASEDDYEYSEDPAELLRFRIDNGKIELILNALADDTDDIEDTPEWIFGIETESVDHKPSLVPDIPVYTNKRIQAFIRLYTQKKRGVFQKALERMPTYQSMIDRILKKHELPANLIYLAVVESNLNPKARSTANAVGLWQFMSYTGKHYGLMRSWWHDDRYDPELSTEAAAKYLKKLHKQFDGNWELALAAYNSGSGTVRRAIRKAKAAGRSTDFWSLRLPRETRGYVPAFYAVSIIFSNLEKYGFAPLGAPHIELEKKAIDVGGGLTLKQISAMFNIETKTLVAMNPRLRYRGLTPPTMSSFDIVLPAHIEITRDHETELKKLKENRHQEWKIHKVRQGETLWSISRKYRIPISEILAYNHLRRKNLLRIGQKLMLPIPSDWKPPRLPSNTKLAIDDLDKLPGVTHIHIVKKGETLWQISQKYDVPLRKIREWNRRELKKRYLKIGTRIVMKLPITLPSESK